MAGHFDLGLGEKHADEVSARDVAVDEDAAEDPVEDRGLPLDEHLVAKIEREAAEDDDDGEADPEHRLDLAAAQHEPTHLQEGGGDGDDGGDEDRSGHGGEALAHKALGKRDGGVGLVLGDLEGREEEDDGEEVEEKFHRKEVRVERDPEILAKLAVDVSGGGPGAEGLVTFRTLFRCFETFSSPGTGIVVQSGAPGRQGTVCDALPQHDMNNGLSLCNLQEK